MWEANPLLDTLVSLLVNLESLIKRLVEERVLLRMVVEINILDHIHEDKKSALHSPLELRHEANDNWKKDENK